MPSLSVKDIGRMSIKEIDKRITFLQKFNKERKGLELKNFASIMHLVVSAGTNNTKKNNKIFQEQLDKIFNDKEPDKEESLEDTLGFLNVKK